MINKIIAILLVALLLLLIICLLYKLHTAGLDAAAYAIALVIGFMWSKLTKDD